MIRTKYSTWNNMGGLPKRQSEGFETGSIAYKWGMELERNSVRSALEGFERIAVQAGEVRGRSAVVLALVPGEQPGETAFVLTRRSSRLRAHKGQWALPGGRLDPGESTHAAGLREFREEIGIQLGPECILGELDDYLTRSGYCITPLVVWAADRPFEPIPNPDEVASVHLIPVQDIDVEARFIEIPESDRPVVQIPLLGSFIHAPTGALLHQFREVVLHGRSTRVAHFEQPVFAWK